jgi:PucR family transcriptional regulator, purine catabolism regulatory protein
MNNMSGGDVLPTVADVLALEPVRRGAPRVLAGHDGLTAQVRWVHVIELAEAGRLLRGGELVLSTGIALPPDPDGLARYVAGLAAAGVSALAVELGSRYLRELPQALVMAAAARRLPLIVLERETEFIAITEAVHAQILDAQVAELRAAQRLDQVLTDLAVAGASQDEIVSRAAGLAGAPVILADLGHRVLACAPAGQDITTLLAGFAARSRAVAVPGGGGYDPVARWLVAPVRTAGEPGGDWARLIFVLSGPPDPAAAVLAERTATTLALARLVGERRDQGSWAAADRPWPQRSAHGALLAALAAPGHGDDRELAARIAALGVPLARRELLPVVLARGGDAGSGAGAAGEAGADELAAACTEAGVPAIVGTLPDGEPAALLATAPGVSDTVLTRLAARLRRSAALRPGGVLGTAWPAQTVAQARRALLTAAEAARAASACQEPWRPARPFARLEDLRFAGLAFRLRDDPRLLGYAERELGPLLASSGDGAGLLAVLAAYLDAGGNKARAAQRAGMARPTLYERISQIQEAIGASLDDPAVRLSLHAALVIRQVTAARGTEPRA